jgi:hypothetical protein
MFVFIPLSPPQTHTTHVATHIAQVQRSGCLSSGTPTKGSIDTVYSESQVFQIVTGNTHTTHTAQVTVRRSGCLGSGTPTKDSIDTVRSESQVFQIVTGKPQPHGTPTTASTQSSLTAMLPAQYSATRDREPAPFSTHLWRCNACNEQEGCVVQHTHNSQHRAVS